MLLEKSILLSAGIHEELFNIKTERTQSNQSSREIAENYYNNQELEEKEEIQDMFDFGIEDFHYRTFLVHPDTQKVFLEITSHYFVDKQGVFRKHNYLSVTVSEDNITESQLTNPYFEIESIQDRKGFEREILFTKLGPGEKKKVMLYLFENGMVLNSASVVENKIKR